MSKKFETVKSYYKSGLWDIGRVRNAVFKGWITEEEFREITATDAEDTAEYTAKNADR